LGPRTGTLQKRGTLAKRWVISRLSFFRERKGRATRSTPETHIRKKGKSEKALKNTSTIFIRKKKESKAENRKDLRAENF